MQGPDQGFPPACIPTCLYLLLTTDSFEEAVIDVVNLGGDADTAGAILGAMAGAYYGAEAIPNRWAGGLQNRDGIEVRALALANRSDAGLISPTWSHRARIDSQGRHHPRTDHVFVRNGGDRGATMCFDAGGTDPA